MVKQKDFLCRFSVLNCDTELDFFLIVKGKNKEEVYENNQVEHDACGLDTEDSPVGGCVGEKCTELCRVYPITASQKKFLNSVGIY